MVMLLCVACSQWFHEECFYEQHSLNLEKKKKKKNEYYGQDMSY